MFRITFLNVPSHNDEIFTVYPPVGILSMAACLKKEGYSVQYIEADACKYSPHDVIDIIENSKPNLIGISLNVSQVKHSVKYIEELISKFPDIPIVVGGPYVSGVKERIFDDFSAISYAIIQEGEYSIIDLVKYLEGKISIDNVRNLIYVKNGTIYRNRLERIEDLSSLPFPDYSLILTIIDKYSAPRPSLGTPSIAIMCGRGCPYNCTFCSSPSNWKRKLTFRSVDSVISEIIYLKETIDVKEVFFQDDTLNARPEWFHELCDKIISNNLHKSIYFKCPFRVNERILTESILRKAKEANFWMIFYGVENGNQQMLNIMNKKVSVDEIKRAFRMTRQHGIASYASFMVGNFGETKQTVSDSIKLLKAIMPDYASFGVAAPFPGSELYRVGKENDLILEYDFKRFQFGECILRTKDLNKDEINYLTLKASNEFLKLKNSFRYKIANRNNIFSKAEGIGVYPSELWHTKVYRTKRNVKLVLPKYGHNYCYISLRVLADNPDIVSSPLKAYFVIGKDKYKITFSSKEWMTLTFGLNNNSARDIIELCWSVSRTWNPKKEGINNDDRELGLTVEKIWME
jgi:anaerobic magnesium-protoporphyrin IX monomethyl ester cyclase